jgi:capsular polysaccharide biosynthesis protein
MQRASSYLKRWVWLLTLCPLLAGGATLVLALVEPPVYEATVNLVFGLTNPTNPTYVLPEAAAQLGGTYTAMLESPEVLQTAAAQLGLQETTEQLSSQVHATYQSGSNIITLTVDASTSDEAAHLADALVNAFRHALQQVSPLGKDLLPWGSAQMNPVKLKGITYSTAGIAVSLGLLIALSFVGLLYYLDDTIFTPDEVRALTDIPVLSVPLPQATWGRQGNMPGQRGGDAAPLLLEAVQASVTWPATIFCVWATARERDPQGVMHLARAAAHAGLRVLILNTDSHDRWLQEMCGISEARGLGDALVTGHALKPYIIPLATPGITVVPAGQASSNGNDAHLSSPQLAQLIAPLRQEADLVLVTGAPVLGGSTAALTRATDGVVLMTIRQRTQRGDVCEALVTLRHVQARVLGIALGPPCEQSNVGKKREVNRPPNREAGNMVIVKEIQESN